MRRAGMGLLSVMVVCLASAPAWGLGGEYPIGADGKIQAGVNPDWPAGLSELINSGPCFRGHFVNANDEFFFLGDAASLTRFLNRYATLKNTPIVVAIHAGSARRSELWGDKPETLYDWKILAQKRGWGAAVIPDKAEEKYLVTVDVWIDRNIRLADLVVPKNVQIVSAGEIEAFMKKQKQ